MSTGLTLVRLACPRCGSPLEAEGEDVVYYCPACHTGSRLAQGPPGVPLSPVEVTFVARPDVEVARYLPFWLLPARVEISQRSTAGGSLSGLMRLFSGEAGAPSNAAGEQREAAFAIPAFAAPLAVRVALARRYTEALPQLGEKLGEQLTGTRISEEDARKLAHYLLVDAEAARPDTLQGLVYSIVFGDGWLLGVPFVASGSVLVDAFFGLPAT
ncbi:MAG TPA: hypothetical protein VF017_05470 [Thermoanaerobaculia bacterium]|nr:hypothetical protein [Thermoanaerobaculia bacterium]